VCEDDVEKLKDYIQVGQIFVFVVYEKFKILFKPPLLRHFLISSSEEVVAVRKI